MKRILVLLIVLLPVIVSGQTLIQKRIGPMGNSSTLVQRQAGVSYYDPLTLAYQSRVVADGGIVVDLNYVDMVYKTMRSLGINTSGLFGVSARAGIKFTTAYNAQGSSISKRYDLFNKHDEYQNNTDSQFFWIPASTFDGKPMVFTTNKTAYADTVTLPTYLDVFMTGDYVKGTLGDRWLIEHGTNATSSIGFYFYGSQGPWSYYRTSANYMNDIGYLNWGMGKLTARNIYNATSRLTFKNGASISYGSISGTLQSNTLITKRLYVFSRNSTLLLSNGYNRDIFIFASLDRTKSDAFELFLRNEFDKNIHNNDSINLLTEGDSQMTAYSCGTISNPTELYLALSENAYQALNNKAVAGQTTRQILINLDTHLNSYYSSTYRNNICVFWMGVNDIGQDTPVYNIYNNIKTAVSKSNAKGFKTFVCTQRTFGSMSPANQSRMLDSTSILNDSIRNGAIAHNYTVIDLAVDQNWNYITAFNDLTWYCSDKIHLTNAAHRRVAYIMYNRIKPYLQ